jgi:hypothetical protein
VGDLVQDRHNLLRIGSTVSVVARNSNQLDLFTTRSDGRVMSIWWNSGGGWASDWFNVQSGHRPRPGRP